MNIIFILIIIAVIIGAIVFFKQNQLQNNSDSSNVVKYKSKPLMTDNEFEFFNRLVEALPNYYVFSQVSMGAVLQVAMVDAKYKNSIRATFSQKIIDYVVYNKDKKIVAIIELDDKTHNVEKDEKRDAMLNQAGYKTLRFNSKNKPSVEEIKKIVG